MWEGEQEVTATEDDVKAMRVHAMLANGMGGIDWTGLDLAVAMFGVRDVEALIERLLVLKLHKPEIPGQGE